MVRWTLCELDPATLRIYGDVCPGDIKMNDRFA